MIKFEIGDRVRFIGEPHEYDYLRRDRLSLEKGDIGTVRENSSVPYVLFDKYPDKSIAVIQENLELVPVNGTFKVGDRVRLITDRFVGGWKLSLNSTGTIVAVRGTPYSSYTVRFDNWHKGHDGDLGFRDHSCLFVNSEDLELIPEKKKEKFKVGDIVRIVRKTGHAYANFPLGIKAKVIAERESGSDWDYIVQLAGEETIGWTYDHIYHNCQNVKAADLELVKEKFKLNIVIYRKGNKVIAQLNNGKCVYAVGEAKCSPNDTFNFAVGSQIALQRLCRKMGDGSSAIVIPEDLKLNELFMY